MSKKEVDVSREIMVTGPDGNKETAAFRYTSDYGRAGCEGWVCPGILTWRGQDQPVQVKRFFRSSFDDRGDQFFQEPDKKTEESYQALGFLQQRGFQVVPFFALGEGLEKDKVLILEDLSQGGQVEVYDEKDLHRGRKVVQIINGTETEQDARSVVEGLENVGEVRMDFLRTDLLQIIHNVSLGFGVCHMVTRNPQTNRGKVFVTDVGEHYQPNQPYREALPSEQLLNVPRGEVKEICARMLRHYHQTIDPERLLEYFIQSDPLRKDFLDLYYQVGVGLASQNYIGGWTGDADWARRKFFRSQFPNHFMTLKLRLDQIKDSYQSNTGHPLFSINSEHRQSFAGAQDNSDLVLGLDFAYQAALDSKISYLISVRDLIDQERPVPRYLQQVNYDSDGFPRMNFFDNWDETREASCIVDLAEQSFLGEAPVRLSVEFDWDQGYEVATSGGMYSASFFHPAQIKELRIGGKVVSDFDPQQVTVINFMGFDTPSVGDLLYYLYGDYYKHPQVIFQKEITLEGERKFAQAILHEFVPPQKTSASNEKRRKRSARNFS